MGGESVSKMEPWPQAAPAAARHNTLHAQLHVWRGEVVSVGDRVTSTTYSGSNGVHTRVNAIPEVWIKDASGQETRFSHSPLAECRVGHEIVIVGDVAKDQLLGLRNLSTGQTWYSNDMDKLPVDAGIILFTVALGVLFCGISWMLGIAIFGEVWGRKTWWQRTAPELLYYGALAIAVMIPERWRRNCNRRREALRTSVDRQIEAASK